MASRSVTSAVASITSAPSACNARTFRIRRDVLVLLAMFLQPAVPGRFLGHRRPADGHQAGLRVPRQMLHQLLTDAAQAAGDQVHPAGAQPGTSARSQGPASSGSKRCTHRPPSRRMTNGSRLLPDKLADQAIGQERFRLRSCRRHNHIQDRARRARHLARQHAADPHQGGLFGMHLALAREAPRSRCRWRSAGPGPPRMPTPATGTSGCRSSGPLRVPRQQGRRHWMSQRTAWVSAPAPRGARYAPAAHSASRSASISLE